MKTGFYSVLCPFVTYAAIGACFLPLLFLCLRNVRQINTFRVLGIYWFLNGIVNLRTLETIHGEGIRYFLSRLSNFYDLADFPLALLIFAVARPGRWRRRLLLVMLGYIVGETLLISRKGYVFSWPVIVGAGVVLIVAFSVAGLWQYLKKMEHDRFENSMVYVYGAFLFAYGTYLIIYLLYYLKTSKASYNQADSSLLYYTSLLLSAIITSIGIFNYGSSGVKRMNPRYSSSSS